MLFILIATGLCLALYLAVDLVPTQAIKAAGRWVRTRSGIAGGNIAAGNAVYRDRSDGLFWEALADGTEEQALVKGIAMHAATAGSPITFAVAGYVDLGVTVAAGTIYHLSATVGGISPDVIASESWVTVLGVGVGSNTLYLSIFASGAQVP